MRTRAYRRYVADKVSFRRWEREAYSSYFQNGIIRSLNSYLGWMSEVPIGKYRKVNQTCYYCRCSWCMSKHREEEAARTRFRKFRSRLIR